MTDDARAYFYRDIYYLNSDINMRMVEQSRLRILVDGEVFFQGRSAAALAEQILHPLVALDYERVQAAEVA